MDARFRRCGLKCFAFTTKHHDGFSMFDTKTRVKRRVNWTAPGGPKIEDCDLAYSIMEMPLRRDIVRELCDAAHRHGIAIDSTSRTSTGTTPISAWIAGILSATRITRRNAIRQAYRPVCPAAPGADPRVPQQLRQGGHALPGHGTARFLLAGGEGDRADGPTAPARRAASGNAALGPTATTRRRRTGSDSAKARPTSGSIGLGW